MKKRHFNKFSIIGAGMVGTAIGYLLKKAGCEIVAIADKSAAALQRAHSYTGGKTYRKPQEVLHDADCILVTTPDDIILSVCKDIACAPSIKGKYIFHMSGAGGLDLLEPAKKAGAAVGSIHPLQSFSSIDNAIKNIPSSYFGIT
ncbi:MAG: NAD(P)-binding domain-containing protein, partial [Deltaproteobacteria bacterium]